MEAEVKVKIPEGGSKGAKKTPPPSRSSKDVVSSPPTHNRRSGSFGERMRTKRTISTSSRGSQNSVDDNLQIVNSAVFRTSPRFSGRHRAAAARSTSSPHGKSRSSSLDRSEDADLDKVVVLESRSSASSVHSPKRRRQSVAIVEYRRSVQRGQRSPKRSLSQSPKYAQKWSPSSRTSLLSKQGSLVGTRPAYTASDTPLENSVNTHAVSDTGYSRPAMEVVISVLIFLGGTITLITALVLGSTSWTIVGSICMAIGGVFTVFGMCFYAAKHKRLKEREEQVEIRIIDAKHIADMARRGFRVRAVMDV